MRPATASPRRTPLAGARPGTRPDGPPRPGGDDRPCGEARPGTASRRSWGRPRQPRRSARSRRSERGCTCRRGLAGVARGLRHGGRQGPARSGGRQGAGAGGGTAPRGRGAALPGVTLHRLEGHRNLAIAEGRRVRAVAVGDGRDARWPDSDRTGACALVRRGRRGARRPRRQHVRLGPAREPANALWFPRRRRAGRRRAPSPGRDRRGGPAGFFLSARGRVTDGLAGSWDARRGRRRSRRGPGRGGARRAWRPPIWSSATETVLRGVGRGRSGWAGADAISAAGRAPGCAAGSVRSGAGRLRLAWRRLHVRLLDGRAAAPGGADRRPRRPATRTRARRGYGDRVERAGSTCLRGRTWQRSSPVGARFARRRSRREATVAGPRNRTGRNAPLPRRPSAAPGLLVVRMPACAGASSRRSSARLRRSQRAVTSTSPDRGGTSPSPCSVG